MADRAKKQARRQRRKISAAALRGIPLDVIVDVSKEIGATAAECLVVAADAESGSKVATFSGRAYSGGVILVNNFSDPVVIDLEGLKVTEKSRPILRNHDQGTIAGHTDGVEIDAGSIRVVGRLSAANDTAREIRESAQNGFPWQLSVGVAVHRAAYLEDGDTIAVNGQEHAGPLVVVKAGELKEISFVALGADDTTSARIAANAASLELENDEMGINQWIEDQGFEFESISDKQRQSLEALYEREHPSGPPPPAEASSDRSDTESETIDAQIAADRETRAAEIIRVEEIKGVCARHGHPKIMIQGDEKSIEALAIGEGWGADKAELEALRANRPAAPAARSGSHAGDCTAEALSAAMIINCGIPIDHPGFASSPQSLALGIPTFLRASLNDDTRQKYMELAHRYSDYSLLQICAESLRIDGQTVPGGRSAMIQAAVSGSSLTNIFTTSINARLLVGFVDEPDTTTGWTQQRDVANFLQYENIRLQKGAGMAVHPRGGSADHWSRTDQQETNKLARYSRQFFVDEQDMIDDRLDAFASIPTDMGQAARRLVPDLVYSVLLANGNLNATGRALFNATEANLDTSSALTAANLKTGVSEMMIVTENGVNLNLSPTHLLVPPALKHAAFELTNSSQIFLAGNTDVERGSLNALAVDGIAPIGEARLQNGVTHPTTDVTYAGAAADWYLINNRVPTIEVAYLRGTGRAPQTSTWRKMGEDGVWGIGFAAKMDVGAAAQEWRGLRKHEA